MLRFALIFAVLALIAGGLGFGGLAVGFAALARFAFFLFLVVAVVALLGHAFRGDVV